MCGLIDVYADLLFLVDFCMDLACISACARITGARVGKGRRALAAALGGGYSVCSLFIPDGVYSLICAAICWQLICLSAFYRLGDSLARHMKLSLCYLAVNALLGGAVSAVFGILGRLSEICLPDAEYKYADSKQRLIFLSLAAACFALRLIIVRIHKLRLDKAAYIRITEFEGSLTLRAICDTGNFLSEPLTGKPCAVISREDLITLGGGSLLSLLGSADGKALEELSVRIALIPARTVNGDGIMPAFFTKIELLDSEKKIIRECEAVVAVSNTGAPGEGSAILPGCLCC